MNTFPDNFYTIPTIIQTVSLNIRKLNIWFVTFDTTFQFHQVFPLFTDDLPRCRLVRDVDGALDGHGLGPL